MRTRTLLFVLVCIVACRRRHNTYTYAPYGLPPPMSATYAYSAAPPGPPMTPTTTNPAPQPGVITDADRAAARDLFTEGSQLQTQGKFAEALDRFQRSNAVFPAPTTYLHIAQCEVALAKLVEGAESYRAIMNTKIPAGAPQAFFDAQKAAASELALVEPRVPRAKIMIVDGAPISVLVDGQPLNLALLGVARPIDPGAHKVVGTSRAGTVEQSFTIKEKEQLEVKLSLKK